MSSPQFPNLNIGLPPLQTPIIAGGGQAAGLPYQMRPTQPLPAGNLHQAWAGWFNQISKIISQVPTISDVAANMVATGGGAAVTDWTPDAWQRFIYFQTDTGVVYVSRILSNIWQWTYMAGAMTVATLADLPTGLGPADEGLIVYELEYFHAYQWDGSAWRFLPGDPGAGYIVATASGAPVGGLWALCDGSVVDVSQGDGTIAATSTPNLVSSGFGGNPPLLGGGGSGFQAASVPEWQTGAKTDDESAHTHNVTATVEVESGTGAFPAATGATSAGTAHSHNLSDANAKLKAPSDGADATHGGGMPDRYYLNWYMRQ
jgi:hypothetical protein